MVPATKFLIFPRLLKSISLKLPMSASKENLFKLPESNQGKRSEFRDPENYRATSLISPLSKILGKTICNRKTERVLQDILFTSVQFGFGSKHSCVHAIGEVIDFKGDIIDIKSIDQACFRDLKKKYDYLDWSQLLRKLSICSFIGFFSEIKINYLTDRWQFVFDEEQITEKTPAITGVPQVIT